MFVKQIFNKIKRLLVVNKQHDEKIIPFNEIIKAADKIRYRPIKNSSANTKSKGIKTISNAGLQLKEIRNYIPGDDVRLIDANTSARHNAPYVKIYEEFVETQALIAIDVSSSIFNNNATTNQLSVLLPSLLTNLLTRNNVNTKIVFFSNKVEHIIPFSTHAIMAKSVYNYLLKQQVQKTQKQTDFNFIFNYLVNDLKTFTEIYLITDGIIPNYNADKLDLQNKLSFAINKLITKHAVQFLLLNNNFAIKNRKYGLINMEDAETGNLLTVDISSKYVQDFYAHENKTKYDFWRKTINNGTSEVAMINDKDFITILQKLFAKRN